MSDNNNATTTTAAAVVTRPAEVYDRHGLKWNDKHSRNTADMYCYCGKPRTLDELNMQCHKCHNWFHQSCALNRIHGVVPFLLDYSFTCAWCSDDGLDHFERCQTGWKSIITTAMANFMVEQAPEKFFTKTDIIPWISEHWKEVTYDRNKTPTWDATIGTTVSTENGTRFLCQDAVRSSGSKYALMEQNLFDLLPTELQKRSSSASERRREDDTSPGESRRSRGIKRSVTAETEGASPSSSESKRSKSLKRSSSANESRKREDGDEGKRRRESDFGPFPSWEDNPHFISKDAYKSLKKGLPTDHPFNRDGFRYTDAEPDPVLSSEDKRYFFAFREKVGEPGVFISRFDRSQSIEIASDRLTATTRKGYRLARATHFCYEGSWFFEVTINDPTPLHTESKEKLPDPHTRLGWARRDATLDAPVGYSKGYAYRDLNGQKVCDAKPTNYGPAAGPGDVIGLLIRLPPSERPSAISCRPKGGRIPIKYKNGLFFEQKEEKTSPEGDAKKEHRGEITFYVNGETPGVAFDDVLPGEYYPAISLYMGACVTVNFGPDFKHPPPKGVEFRPFYERYEEEACLAALLDVMDEVVRLEENPTSSSLANAQDSDELEIK